MKLLLAGQLPFILLVATVLALPISFGLLLPYRRAVVRSGRATASSRDTRDRHTSIDHQTEWAQFEG